MARGGKGQAAAALMLGTALFGAALCGLGPAAQPVQAQAVVQSLPGGASQMLNAALARLGRDPRDLGALIDAGNAALMMGDVEAAIGFFARADQLSPNNMRVKAGLAGALVRSENPYDAIPLFAEAEKAGAVDPMLAADRGLAYDLVGDNATAQKFYRQALAAGPSDETLRRLALSQSIAGDRAGMEATLSPLLQREDKAAWRARAFALGILGKGEEAVAIANQTMPADLANGIAPYLRYMPRLTPAQQAAAANFGRFPRAAEIGHDDPRVALYAPPKPAALAAAPVAPRSAPPEPMPGRQIGAAPALVVLVQPDKPAPPATALAAAPAPAPVRIAAANPPAPAPVPAPTVARPAAVPAAGAATVTEPGFDLARLAPPAPVRPAAPVPVNAPPPVAAAPTPAPVTAAPPRQPPARPMRVADAFGDLALPSGPAAPAPGAVDIRKIAPARPKPPEPPKPAHPSRIWVQVGTGRDKAALGYTWRGLVKDEPALMRGKSPAISDWGRTNRLLTGPFATEAAADAFLAKLKKAGLDAFMWTSPAGQVVDELAVR